MDAASRSTTIGPAAVLALAVGGTLLFGFGDALVALAVDSESLFVLTWVLAWTLLSGRGSSPSSRWWH